MWPLTAISAKGAPCTGRFVHGLGVGDMNLDGRKDVIVREGWWEAPPAEECKENGSSTRPTWAPIARRCLRTTSTATATTTC